MSLKSDIPNRIARRNARRRLLAAAVEASRPDRDSACLDSVAARAALVLCDGLVWDIQPDTTGAVINRTWTGRHLQSEWGKLGVGEM